MEGSSGLIRERRAEDLEESMLDLVATVSFRERWRGKRRDSADHIDRRLGICRRVAALGRPPGPPSDASRLTDPSILVGVYAPDAGRVAPLRHLPCRNRGMRDAWIKYRPEVTEGSHEMAIIRGRDR